LQALNDDNWTEGLEFVQRAIELIGPNPEVLDTRALLYLKAKRPDRALQDLNQAIAQAPTPTMYVHLAQAQLMAKNAPAAAEAFRKAKEIGLQVDILHPLEKPAYQQLAAELKD